MYITTTLPTMSPSTATPPSNALLSTENTPQNITENDSEQLHHVVIIGGGFGGYMQPKSSANRTSKLH